MVNPQNRKSKMQKTLQKQKLHRQNLSKSWIPNLGPPRLAQQQAQGKTQ